ncbi:MAG TPA: tetratricopeptide repeat protein, partial [Chloroflexota bacterium]
PLLTGGSRERPERQQTLRGAIAWSYDLLTEPERELVRRLGAFAGSFDVEAVAALCPGQYDFELLDTLDLLAAKSLVVADISGPATRYAMLQTIREFVLEQLRWSGEEEDVRQRHADHFLALAEQAEPMLRGAEQTAWSERLEQEHDNLRAALEWLVQADGAEEAWRLAGALYPFWSLRGYFGAARTLLARAVEVGRELPGVDRSAARAKVLHVMGRLAQMTNPNRAREFYLESLAIRRSVADPQGTASTLNQLGSIARYQGDYATAREMYREALTIVRALGDEWGATILLNNLGILARMRGEYAEARELSLESLDLARARRDETNAAIALDNLGEVEYEDRSFQSASRYLEEGIAIQRRIGHRLGEAETLWALGNVARECGDHALASRRYDEALAIWSETGYQRFIGLVYTEKSLLALDRGDQGEAQRLLHECAPLLQDLGEQRYLAHALEALGALAAARGDADEAVALAAAATTLRESIGAPRAPVDQARLAGWLGVSSASLTREAHRSAWSLGAVAPIGELIDCYRTVKGPSSEAGRPGIGTQVSTSTDGEVARTS